MTHYAHIFTINRQILSVNLGYYTEERGKKQRVEVDLRLYFPESPECARTDKAPFIDYGILVEAIKDFTVSREFSLVEHLGTELFYLLRGILTEHCGNDLKLWLRLTKITTPIEGLEGGASYVTSDLPAGATFPPAL